MKTCGSFLLLLLLLENSLSTSVPCPPCECFLRAKELFARCSKKDLTEIPDAIPRIVNHLFLNGNKIQVNTTTFQRFKDLMTLDLSSNTIDTLGVETFVHNRKLKTLNLNINRLGNEGLLKGVFRYQKNLKYLELVENQMSVYPDSALSDLTNLSSLVVDGLPIPFFGKGFAKLKLRNLDMSGNGRPCQTRYLKNESFINLEHLFHLDVSNCVIIQIDAGAFFPMRQIVTLDVSNNKYLGYDVFGQSCYGLRYSSIRKVKADNIVSGYSIGQVLRLNQVKYLVDTNITELSFDFNSLEIVESNVSVYLSKLEHLSIRGNRLVFGAYLLETDRLSNLKILQASDQYESTSINMFNGHLMGRNNKWGKLPKRYVKGSSRGNEAHFSYFENDLEQRKLSREQDNSQVVHLSKQVKDAGLFENKKEFRKFDFPKKGFKFTIPFPKQMQTMNISNSKLAYYIPLIVFYNNSLEVIDASGNLFTKWVGPLTSVTGHLQLNYIDLSNNFCKEINSTFFHTVPFLRTLNIGNNYLSEDLSNDMEGMIFRHSKQLRTLRISHNILQDLPQALFSELRELEHLDLSWNSLSTWTVAISHMIHLQHLDISFNRFLEIPKSLRTDINTIMANHQALRISIKGNSLRCDCQTVNSLQWMLDSKVTFPELNVTQCQQEDMSIIYLGDLQELVRKLQLRCGTTASLVVGLSLGVFVCLLLFVAGVLYRYRWKLRYLYYTTRRKHRGYKRLDQEQDNFTYDAFISYADEDRSFVIDDMRVILEERYGLKLCIHHRDFMVGQAITDNIINAIQTSRRTVVVLSPDFVKSSWCLYEVHMARLECVYTGRDVMCVVWYRDPPSTRDLSSDLLEELATGTYLKYNEEEQEMFWQSLRDALVGIRD